MSGAYLVAAVRTAVVPRDGAFRTIEPWGLAARLMCALEMQAGKIWREAEDVIFGNALHAGGNPARLAALAAGLPEGVPAVTIDTQCCGGLDAIALAADRIAAGRARIVIAGGLESYSRAPLRLRRPLHAGEEPVAYARPPFAPWPDRDPDMTQAAANLAAKLSIPRAAQEAFAIDSHRKARAADHAAEIVPVDGVAADAFTRDLTPALCARLPALAGTAPHEITAATTAVEADAAALVLVVDGQTARANNWLRPPLRIFGTQQTGGDPAMPGLAPIASARGLLTGLDIATGSLAAIEIMEAYAAQAMAFVAALDLDPRRVNIGGGALSRGHPVGASGAILAVRLAHELWKRSEGACGLCAIAAAGGLGSAMMIGNAGP